MAETKPNVVLSLCTGLGDHCKECPHAGAHRCTDSLDVCIQGNEKAHRRVNVQCLPLDLTRAKHRLALRLADAKSDLVDGIAEALSRYVEACDRAEEQYETDAAAELYADQAD
jgi:hypothetical protein